MGPVIHFLVGRFSVQMSNTHTTYVLLWPSAEIDESQINREVILARFRAQAKILSALLVLRSFCFSGFYASATICPRGSDGGVYQFL